MPIEPTRFSIWSGASGPWSAVDGVILDLEDLVKGTLAEAEEDGVFLGHLGAYLHILAAVGEATGGYGQTSLDLKDLEKRTLAAHDVHSAEHPNTPPEEFEDEREFLNSVFARLHALKADSDD